MDISRSTRDGRNGLQNRLLVAAFYFPNVDWCCKFIKTMADGLLRKQDLYFPHKHEILCHLWNLSIPFVYRDRFRQTRDNCVGMSVTVYLCPRGVGAHTEGDSCHFKIRQRAWPAVIFTLSLCARWRRRMPRNRACLKRSSSPHRSGRRTSRTSRSRSPPCPAMNWSSMGLRTCSTCSRTRTGAARRSEPDRHHRELQYPRHRHQFPELRPRVLGRPLRGRRVPGAPERAHQRTGGRGAGGGAARPPGHAVRAQLVRRGSTAEHGGAVPRDGRLF